MLGPSTTVILVLVALLISGIKVLREYERAVVMRLVASSARAGRESST